jgi:hypothetical protein
VRALLLAEPHLAEDLILPEAALLLAPLASPPLAPGEAAGLDMILEGFLLHHGNPRHLRPHDRRREVLVGDYCYAHGLVRVAEAGDLYVIDALSELIALGAGLVAAGGRDALAPLWRATVAAIAARGGPAQERVAARLEGAKRALRRRRDRGPLEAVAAELPATPELAEAFAA